MPSAFSSVSRPGAPHAPCNRQRPGFLLAAALCFAAVIVPPDVRAEAGPPQEEMPVAGGTARLLRVARVAAPVEPARALRVLVRTLYRTVPADDPGRARRAGVYLAAVTDLRHAAPVANDPRANRPFLDACGLVRDGRRIRAGTSRADAERRRLLADAGFPLDDWTRQLDRGEPVAAEVGEDRVPALLPPAVWGRAVFGEDLSLADLAPAILRDRRAALLYYGLFSLDQDTLGFFARHPSLVSTIHAEHAAVFAAFAESIAVHDGRVMLPGTASAAPLWEALVGAPASSPERFLERLLADGDGRLAWLFDTVAHADPARQAFALGGALESPDARLAQLTRLYAVFRQFERREWLIRDRPFSVSHVDPAFMLQQVAATPDGRMSPPRGLSLWEAAFDGAPAPASPAAGEVTAAWLLEHLATGSTATRRARLDSVLFAQRLRARGTAVASPAPGAGALGECLAAFPAHQMLATTLEHLGFVDPRDCVRAVRGADALVAGGDRRRASLRLAMFQGALALAVRLADTGAVEPAASRDLVRSLVALPPDPGYALGVAGWIETSLLTALPAAAPTTRMATAEDRLLDGLAAVGRAQPLPIVEWEGHRYRVDVAAAERARLQRIRRKQDGTTLDAALDAARLAATIAGAGSSDGAVERAGAALEKAVPAVTPPGRRLFGFDVADLVDTLSAAAREASEGRRSADAAECRRRLTDGLAVVFGDVLASYAYALAIGDPDSAMVLAENPAYRHDFTVGATIDQGGPWAFPVGVRVGSASAVRGSLVGLERGLGMSWLRPTTLAPPARVPTMTLQDVEGLGEGVAALNPFRLSDRARDWLAEALRRGRARVAASTGNPADLDRLLETAGVEGWRRRLARLAAAQDTGRVGGYLSLGEVLSLGCADLTAPDLEAWGLPQRAVDGSLRVQLPPRLAWHAVSGRVGAGLLPARVPDLLLRVTDWLAAARLPAALVPGILARAAWDLARNTAVADPDDWLPIMRAAQAVTADRMADYVAAQTAGGTMVLVTERQTGQASRAPECGRDDPGLR